MWYSGHIERYQVADVVLHSLKPFRLRRKIGRPLLQSSFVSRLALHERLQRVFEFAALESLGQHQ